MIKNNLIKKEEVEFKKLSLFLILLLSVGLLFEILVYILTNKPGSSEDLVAFFKLVSFCSLFMAGVSIIALIINAVVFKYGINRVKKNPEYTQIEQEIKSNDKEEFLDINVILTQNYIVDLSKTYKVIKYKDILWLFDNMQKLDNGRKIYWITVRTKDNKKYIIADSTQNFEDEFRKVYQKIQEKVPQALIGNSKENLERYKNFIK